MRLESGSAAAIVAAAHQITFQDKDRYRSVIVFVAVIVVIIVFITVIVVVLIVIRLVGATIVILIGLVVATIIVVLIVIRLVAAAIVILIGLVTTAIIVVLIVIGLVAATIIIFVVIRLVVLRNFDFSNADAPAAITVVLVQKGTRTIGSEYSFKFALRQLAVAVTINVTKRPLLSDCRYRKNSTKRRRH
jgi:hypothetical protein